MRKQAKRGLLEGTERCPHCLQLHVLEQEYRCVLCDGPVCPFCVVIEEGAQDILCPSCSDAERRGRGKPHAG
ncbi:MAG: hypothetical protein ACE15D_03075 [Candidatus Eisenbacteria bacterium]|nr:hypothetical protein [Candidatus Eisenbacteria bacterium]